MLNPIIVKTIQNTNVSAEYEYPFCGGLGSDEDDAEASGFREGFEQAQKMLKTEIVKKLKHLEQKGII